MVEKSLAGIRRLGAGVQQHEAAGAVRVLRLARAVARLAEQRRLLVARDPGDRRPRRRSSAVRAVHLRRGQRLGERARRRRRGARTAGVPAQVVDVEQHRPRRVRVVGDVAPRELAQRATSRSSRSSRPPRARAPATLSQQPLDLGRREVRVEHEAGALANQRLVAGGLQLVAARGRAPVLPDDRAVDAARPSPRSQATTVSRWFVIPIPAARRRRPRRCRSPRRRRVA